MNNITLLKSRKLISQDGVNIIEYGLERRRTRPQDVGVASDGPRLQVAIVLTRPPDGSIVD